MKKLFLTSSIESVAKDIAKRLNNKSKRIAFISTASELKKRDSKWFDNDKNALIEAGFELFDYTVTGKSLEQLNKDLSKFEIIHVNGGNTFYLLLQVRKSGFDKFIKNFIEKGGIYMGSSAGSILAAPDIYPTSKIDTKIYEEELKTFEGLNLVNFTVFPHWGSSHFRELYLNHRLDLAYDKGRKIILLADTEYIIVEDDMLKIIDTNIK